MKDFVPYELAVKLKELGFEKECLAYYSLEKGFEKAFIYAITPYQLDLLVQSPTFSQAFRWFRENGIDTAIIPMIIDTYKEYQFIIFALDEVVEVGFDTYEEAELACLTKLIEIVETRTK